MVCQRNKVETLHPAGLLQPLPVPAAIWSEISLDFIEGLPKVSGKTVILTVVDRLSKYAHFIALGHPYSAESVARAFFAEIVRLHGVPTSIVSNRDPVFTLAFWQGLFRASGSKLHMSTAFHPQTVGQSEVVNRTIAMYLRCMMRDRPRQWVQWLPWAEYIYNTSYHSALRETPFKLVYGRDPPSLTSYDVADIRVAVVAQTLEERAEFIHDIRCCLEQAQAVAKRNYDRGHRELLYAVGDWVWLRLHHRPAATVTGPQRGKLQPRYFGPYKIIEVINQVACCLELPPGLRLHPVFHVCLLKKFVSDPPATPPSLPPIHHRAMVPIPERALKAWLCRGVCQILVRWQGLPASSTSWEDIPQFQQRYPHFQLADDLLLEGGGVMLRGGAHISAVGALR